MKFFILILLNFITLKMAIAETRDKIREREITKNITNSSPNENNHFKQTDPNQNLGLFKVKSNSLTGIDLTNNFKYKLIAKIYCTSANGFWQMIPKFKEIKWKIDFNSDKYETGSTQTDETGLISLYFTAPNEITNQNIEFELNKSKISSPIGKGNHIYYFPPEGCKKSDK